jgi:hypothetical protein
MCQAKQNAISASRPTREIKECPRRNLFKPVDFPVHTKQTEIVTDTGKPIAGACDKETAQDVADRLNSDHSREKEDRWA